MAEELKLFIVARDGNDEEGPNGADTCFLVRTDTHIRAAEIVDGERLRYMPDHNVAPFCHVVREIGVSQPLGRDDLTRNEILLGPSIEFAYNRGRYPQWSRDEQGGEWVREDYGGNIAREEPNEGRVDPS